MDLSLYAIGRNIREAIVPAKARERESNMELLRIVAMSMILCGHFVNHSLGIVTDTIYILTEPFFISGINLFFLISGWFGIRFSIRSLVRLIVTVVLFTAVSLGLLAIQGVYVSQEDISNILMWPVSKSVYWFVAVYLMLFMVSPVLNGGLAAMTRRQTGLCVLLMTLLCVYGGYFAGNYVNVNGKSFIQAVWLYVTAHWLRQCMPLISRVNRNWWLVAFLAAKGVFIALLFRNGIVDKFFYHNNPLTVAASVALFLYFTQLRFRNTAVNVIAKGVFGCYLLQDGLFGHRFMYAKITEIHNNACGMYGVYEGLLHSVAACFVAFVAIWCVSLILTPVVDRISLWVGIRADRTVNKVLK